MAVWKYCDDTVNNISENVLVTYLICDLRIGAVLEQKYRRI
jgi:hypothetical protein